MVDCPTRGEAILDLVLTNDPSLFLSVVIEEPLLGCDHNSIHCKLAVDLSPKFSSDMHNKLFDFSKADWDLFSKTLDSANLSSLLDVDDPELNWLHFKAEVFSAAHLAVPVKSRVKFYRGVPLLRDVKRAVHARKKTYRRYSRIHDSYANEKRQQADDRLREAVEAANAKYEKDLASKCKKDPKVFWKRVRSSLGCKPKISGLRRSDDSLASDPSEIADMLNAHFCSIFKDDANLSLPSLNSHPETTCNLNEIDFCEEEVGDAVRKLPRGSSPGPDGIYNEMLIGGGNSVIGFLTIFFRKILTKGYVPSDWCDANVAPIFKKGARDDCNNYRPISLTSCVCKLFERLVHKKLIHYLTENKLLYRSQHGFLPRRSTLSSLLSFTEMVSRAVENGLYVDVIYIDFAKAFDSVPHSRLLMKIQHLGVCGDLLMWIRQFISGRRQRVIAKGASSSWMPVLSGVPQGSVLGPLFFLIFINDIDQCFKNSKIFKFADDIKIVSTSAQSKNDIHASLSLQEDLARLDSWCSRWLLDVNLSKCKVLHFGNGNPMSFFFLRGQRLPAVTSESDLGVTVSHDLQAALQCSNAAFKAHRVLNCLKLSFKHLDKDVVLTLYKTMVRPLLDYCGPAWCPYLKKDVAVLEKVQRRMSKLISNIRHMSYSDRLSALSLTTLSTRRLRYDLILVYKILNGLIDVDNDFFSFATYTGTRGHKMKLTIHHNRLDIRKYCFSQRVVPVWNSLPESCISASSLRLFKGMVDIYLQKEGYT